MRHGEDGWQVAGVNGDQLFVPVGLRQWKCERKVERAGPPVRALQYDNGFSNEGQRSSRRHTKGRIMTASTASHHYPGNGDVDSRARRSALRRR